MIATNATVLFAGEVESVSVKGSLLKARCVSAGTILDRKVPRVLIQPACNYSLFYGGCGLVSTNWKWTGTFYSVGSAGYPFSFVVESLSRVTGPLVTLTENYFAGGWLELYSGAYWQRRSILLSSAPVTGRITLTLDRDPNPFPNNGDGCILFPGCDGTKETCADKFNNYASFGGHPFVPVGNPSLIKMSKSIGGGKK